MAGKKTSIGGQALIEGIMMRGPERTAMAVRNASGTIITEEWETESKVPKVCRLPIIRGVYGMVTSMILGYKCMMRSADIALSDALAEEEPTEESTSESSEASTDKAGTAVDSNSADDHPIAPKSVCATEAVSASDGSTGAGSLQESKDTSESDRSSALKSDPEANGKSKNPSTGKLLDAMMIVSILIGVVLMVGLFIFIPSLLGGLIFGEEVSGVAALGRSAFEGVLKIALLVLYMWGISFMKDIRRTFQYHGAEHKTIFCYEHGHPLTVENVRKEGRFHPRCGTSFLILMLIVSIFIGFFIRISNPLLRTLVKLLLLPITVGFGYELIKFAGRHDNILTKIISAPGVALQHLTVFEPDDSMIECAITAMTAVIPEDRNKDNW